MDILTLNIVGAGKVGTTLGRLWAQSKSVVIQDIVNKRFESAQQAAVFIGQGNAHESVQQMTAADLYMIAVADSAIEDICNTLVATNNLKPGTVVFHCSGALSSKILSAAATAGAHIASVHPVKSFADAKSASESFSGTYCAFEGDSIAVQTLKAIFEKIDAQVFNIDASTKPLYHASLNLVCQNLTALVELGIRSMHGAGVPREEAECFIAALALNTIENISTLGTSKALTGPIVRGDAQTVNQHVDSLQQYSSLSGDVYRLLGKIALELAALPEKNRLEMQALLQEKSK